MENSGSAGEITPVPFDFPGAERNRTATPDKPASARPRMRGKSGHTHMNIAAECQDEGNFRPGYAGPGEDMRSWSSRAGLGTVRREPHRMKQERRQDPMAEDDIAHQFRLRRTHPYRFLELMDQRVAQHPDDAKAYFARHQAWSRLDRLDLALADLDKSLALQDRFTAHDAREISFTASVVIAKLSMPTIARADGSDRVEQRLRAVVSGRLPRPAR